MNSLIDESESVLCVVDVQAGFLGKLPPTVADETVSSIRWLVQVAVALAIPLVVTEENPEDNGPTVDAVVAKLPKDTKRWPKGSFALADQAEILHAVESTQRRTAIVCGLETDVCVAQSALRLQDLGYRVVGVVDAVASPGSGHEMGLARMRDSGVTLVAAKGLVYEWLRTVRRSDELDAKLSDDIPAGVIL